MNAAYQDMDLQDAIRRLEIPESILRNMIRRFLNRDFPDKLQSAFSENDREKLRLHFHTIKGSGANLGLTGLSRYAAEAETALKNGETLPDETFGNVAALWDGLKLHFME